MPLSTLLYQRVVAFQILCVSFHLTILMKNCWLGIWFSTEAIFYKSNFPPSTGNLDFFQWTTIYPQESRKLMNHISGCIKLVMGGITKEETHEIQWVPTSRQYCYHLPRYKRTLLTHRDVRQLVCRSMGIDTVKVGPSDINPSKNQGSTYITLIPG